MAEPDGALVYEFRCACNTHLMHGVCDDECPCHSQVSVQRYSNGDLRVVTRIQQFQP